jgi:hypothetical protein
MTREAFDLDVTRVARERLHPHGCSVVDSVDDGITRFVIRVRGGGRNADTIEARIFANTRTGQKDGGLTNDPRPQRN